jgi:alpha-1,3-rhamnosyl/mannosyltransferase
MVDASDTAGFADAMQALIDDRTLRTRLIAAGSERAQRFSWRRTAEETLDVYRQVVA